MRDCDPGYHPGPEGTCDGKTEPLKPVTDCGRKPAPLGIRRETLCLKNLEGEVPQLTLPFLPSVFSGEISFCCMHVFSYVGGNFLIRNQGKLEALPLLNHFNKVRGKGCRMNQYFL